jgi:hypothetical protein
MGLFERWLEIERGAGRPMTAILDDLNAACDTKYRHNWPSMMSRREYSLDRLPSCVRRHMMKIVVPVELEKSGVKLSPKNLDKFIALIS